MWSHWNEYHKKHQGSWCQCIDFYWWTQSEGQNLRSPLSPLIEDCVRWGCLPFFVLCIYLISLKAIIVASQGRWKQKWRKEWILFVVVVVVNIIKHRHLHASCILSSCNHGVHHLCRYKSQKKAFTKTSKKWTDDFGKKSIENNFRKMLRYCKVIRVIAHSQVNWTIFDICEMIFYVDLMKRCDVLRHMVLNSRCHTLQWWIMVLKGGWAALINVWWRTATSQSNLPFGWQVLVYSSDCL